MPWFTRGFYRWATRLALPLALIYFYWRGRREPEYRAHWAERRGNCGWLAGRPLWCHAASVGEVVLVAPLLEALLGRGEAVLLTVMTPSGRARARERFGDRLICRYAPLDTPGATARFVRTARPRLAVFAETELWPNLIEAIARAGVPLIVLNAAVSERSAVRYARWPVAGLIAATLRRISALGAASTAHAERFRRLGVDAARITVTGNLKYDGEAPIAAIAAGRAVRARWRAESRPIWVAASTHAGEEARVLDVFMRLRSDFPQLLLVIAPRHPQRFDTVAGLLAERGLRFARRGVNAAVARDVDVVLADTLGEVPVLYAAADVALVGGSLVAGINGHNVVEPAALGRPVCVGANVGEWREIVDALVAVDAAAMCSDAKALAEQLASWLAEPDRAAAAGRAGRALVAARRGALNASLGLIDRALECRARPSP